MGAVAALPMGIVAGLLAMVGLGRIEPGSGRSAGDGDPAWLVSTARAVPGGPGSGGSAGVGADPLVLELFVAEGPSLVRLARLFVDDGTAAEDLVQEAFIRLARSTHRIQDRGRAAAYLRSIVLNLSRDHNRRGLVSLRHQPSRALPPPSVEDKIVLAESQRAVLDALAALAPRQRDCLVLRYYDELGIDDIAATLGVSRNSVKTHLSRGLRALERELAGVATAGPEWDG
jgi:RNA polymerase sigma-70 factor (sigma-E family)